SVPVASDVDGTVLSYALVNDLGTGNGSLTFNADGTYSFNPGSDFDSLAVGTSRDVTFSYSAIDNNGGSSAPATVTITVNGANDAPNGTDNGVSLAEDGSKVFTAGDFGFTDVDAGDSLQGVRIDSLPAAGSLTLNGVAVTAGQVITLAQIGSLTFTPAANANGNNYASLTFSVQDASGAFSAAPNTLTLNVTPVNDAPLAADDTLGQGLIVRGEIVSLGGGNVSVDHWNIQHGGGQFIADILTEYGGSNYVDVNGNGSQQAMDSYIYLIAANGSVVAVNDDNGNNADGSVHPYDSYLSINNLPAGNYSLVISAFSLSPAEIASGVNGASTYGPYQISFGGAVTVISLPNGGEITQHNGAATEDNALTIAPSTLLGNDSDIDGDSLSIVSVQGAINGSVALDVNGNVVFTPAANYNGPASFTYTVGDGSGGLDTATVNLTVNPVNDVPVAITGDAATGENTTL
ncbi:MAG: DVUA0089 family protein, partial [Polaromonas sp.]